MNVTKSSMENGSIEVTQPERTDSNPLYELGTGNEALKHAAFSHFPV